nr:hypothetical protein [Tanacetum cinerariifolium]
MDLFGPTFVKSLNKKRYCLVVIDDYSRFTWVFFLATKDETSSILKTFITGIENQLSFKVKIIRSDNRTKFKNQDLNQFCGMKGIEREFSVARTPQQNGIAERKNRTLIEAGRTMLADSLLPIPFWAEAINTACYVQNRVLVTKPHNKTPYELLLSRTPSISFMRPFGGLVTILNTLDPLGSGPTWLFNIDTLTKSMNYQRVLAGNQPNPSEGIQEHFDADKAGEGNVQQYVLFPLWSSGSKDPQNTNDDTTFEVHEPESAVHVSPSSSANTKKHDDKTKREAKDKSPVDTPVPAVGQILTNNTNTFSAAGPFNTVVSPTLRKSSYMDPSQYPDDPNMPALEDITYSDDKEDVEEVYVCQPLRFEDPNYPDKVYKVVKALYGLHQAPKACYETLANYLLENGFHKERLIRPCSSRSKKKQDGIFISHDKYVAEILRKFRLTDEKSVSTPIDTEKPLLKDPDGEDVDVHTYRSMIGSLMYLTSSRPDILFAVFGCAHFQVTPNALHLHAVKRIFRYLKGKPHLGLWYPKDLPFNLVAYLDSDYAGASLDKKSTTRGCQFLCCRLISWQCKKQIVVATLSTEAEYVAAASCCAQVLWI